MNRFDSWDKDEDAIDLLSRSNQQNVTEFYDRATHQYCMIFRYVLLLISYFADYEYEINLWAIFDNVLCECYVCQKSVC